MLRNVDSAGEPAEQSHLGGVAGMRNLFSMMPCADLQGMVPPAFVFPRRLSEWAGFYNYVEVGLWPAVALVMIGYAIRRRGVVRMDCIIAAVTLILFGASDWFEEANGNEWWHPWWLLLWKVACGATLFMLVIRAAVRRKHSRSHQMTSPGHLEEREARGMINSGSDSGGR